MELVMLRRIESEVGFDIPVQELFDLAIGTSTGMDLLIVHSSRADSQRRRHRSPEPFQDELEDQLRYFSIRKPQ